VADEILCGAASIDRPVGRPASGLPACDYCVCVSVAINPRHFTGHLHVCVSRRWRCTQLLESHFTYPRHAAALSKIDVGSSRNRVNAITELLLALQRQRRNKMPRNVFHVQSPSVFPRTLLFSFPFLCPFLPSREAAQCPFKTT